MASFATELPRGLPLPLFSRVPLSSWLKLLAGALAIYLVPRIFATNTYLLVVFTQIAYTYLLVVGLNLLIGLSGQISLGHVGLFGIGAYTAALFSARLGWSIWQTLPLAAILAGLAGVLLALPTLRAKGPYLAMVTIAFGFIVQFSVAQIFLDITGMKNALYAVLGWFGAQRPIGWVETFGTFGTNGPGGIGGIKVAGFDGWWFIPKARFDQIGYLTLVGVIALIGTVLANNLMDSRVGRTLRALSRSEIAAETVGVNVYRWKVLAFVVSAVYAGVAGALFAHDGKGVNVPSIGPESIVFAQSVLFLVAVILGGTGTKYGPLIGTALVIGIPELAGNLVDYKLLIYGGILLGVLVALPDGILGTLLRFPKARRSRLALGGLILLWLLTLVMEINRIADLVPENYANALRANEALLLLASALAFYGPWRRVLTALNIPAISRRADLSQWLIRGLLGVWALVLLVQIVALANTANATVTVPLLLNLLLAIVALALFFLVEPLARRLDPLMARALRSPILWYALAVVAALLAGLFLLCLLEVLNVRAGDFVFDRLTNAILVVGLAALASVAVLRARRPAPRLAERAPAATAQAALGRVNGSRSAAYADGTLAAAKQVTRDFGGLRAVDKVDLEITPGSIHALIGPNGSGKSTFVNLLSGVYEPSGGTITFQGKLLNKLKPHDMARLGITRTFQNLQLFQEMTVLENVMVGFHTQAKRGFFAQIVRSEGAMREEARFRERALVLLSFLGLEQRARDEVQNLSYGEQRLVEIARALAVEPQLLLLDEPAAGVNPKEVQRLSRTIEQIRAAGITVLVIEHHMDLVMGISDTVTVLDFGEKIAEGKPATVQADKRVIEAYLGA